MGVLGINKFRVLQYSSSYAFPRFSNEYKAILNEAIASYGVQSLPSLTDQYIQNQIIVEAKASSPNIWDKSDIIYFYRGTGSREFKLINWKDPSGNKALVKYNFSNTVNIPFTLQFETTGLRGDGLGMLICDHDFSTLPNFKQDDASFFFDIVADHPSSGSTYMTILGPATNGDPDYYGAGHIFNYRHKLNSPSSLGLMVHTTTPAPNLFSLHRESPDTLRASNNTTTQTRTSTPSQAIPSGQDLGIMGKNHDWVSADYSRGKMQAGFVIFGANLHGSQQDVIDIFKTNKVAGYTIYETIANAYNDRVEVAAGRVEGIPNLVDKITSLDNSESLVLIPSGYKIGGIYPQVPTIGTSDITGFTRSTTKTRLNSGSKVETVGINVPLIEFNNDIPSLLIDGGTTNYVPYSEAIESWDALSSNLTVTNDGTLFRGFPTRKVVANNGVTGQAKCTPSVTNSAGYYYTVRFYVKATGGLRYMAFSARGTTVPSAYFSVIDLVNGTIDVSGQENIGRISDVGNGWYEVILMHQAGTGMTSIALEPLGTSVAATGTLVGDGLKGFYLAQVHQDLNRDSGGCWYPNPYIKTNGSSVTTTTDTFLLNVPTITTEFTLYFEAKLKGYSGNYNFPILRLKSSDDQHFVHFHASSLNNIEPGSMDTGIYTWGTVSVNNSGGNETEYKKYVIVGSGTTISFFIDGQFKETVTGFSGISNLSQLESKTGTPFWHMQVAFKEIKLWDTAKSDADAIILTTL